MNRVDIPDAAGAEDVACLVLYLANADIPPWVLAGGLMVHAYYLMTKAR